MQTTEKVRACGEEGAERFLRITVEDIARLAGVSKATVSRVINGNPTGVGEKTRERVQKIVDELNYQTNPFAKNYTPSHSKTIGLIIPDVTNPFFSELVKAIENFSSDNGYVVIFGNTNSSPEKESRYLSTFIAKKVDGIILTSSAKECLDSHHLLEKYRIPCILLDRTLPGMQYTAGVFADNQLATYRSCEMMLSHGAQKVVFLSGPMDISTAKERIEGYRAALEKYGIPFDESLIKYGTYSVESGYGAIMELEREGQRYDGVVAANDTMALGAIRALRELAYRIPEDVEVAGFDNIDYAQMCDPPLTTVQQPTIEMGRKAAQLLLDAIDGKPPKEKNVRLLPRLVIRKTTK